jgi:GNAT superfamily N-acetyltransferase
MPETYYLHQLQFDGAVAPSDEYLARRAAEVLLADYMYGPEGAETSDEYVAELTVGSAVMHVVSDGLPSDLDSQVVAAAMACYDRSALEYATAASVDRLAVDRNHRRRGHASALLGDIAARALREGFPALSLYAINQSEAFYRKLGFTSLGSADGQMMGAASQTVIDVVQAATVRRRAKQKPSERTVYRSV